MQSITRPIGCSIWTSEYPVDNGLFCFLQYIQLKQQGAVYVDGVRLSMLPALPVPGHPDVKIQQIGSEVVSKPHSGVTCWFRAYVRAVYRRCPGKGGRNHPGQCFTVLWKPTSLDLKSIAFVRLSNNRHMCLDPKWKTEKRELEGI